MGLKSWARGRAIRMLLEKLADKLEQAAKGGIGGAMDWSKVLHWGEALLWTLAPLIIDEAIRQLGGDASLDWKQLGLFSLASLAAYLRKQAKGV